MFSKVKSNLCVVKGMRLLGNLKNIRPGHMVVFLSYCANFISTHQQAGKQIISPRDFLIPEKAGNSEKTMFANHPKHMTSSGSDRSKGVLKLPSQCLWACRAFWMFGAKRCCSMPLVILANGCRFRNSCCRAATNNL